MDKIAGLPWPVAAVILLLPIVGGAIAWLYKWATAPSRLVDLLRRALDKGRIREGALANVVELLVFAIDHVEDPSPAILQLRERATDVLELAHAQLQRISNGGQA